MQLAAPIYLLKRRARLMARDNQIPLHRALDRVAGEEGFQTWSHLAASATHQSPADAVLRGLAPGEFVLIGARPGQGKTLLGLELAVKAAALGRQGYFFTLEFTDGDVAAHLAMLDPDPGADGMVVDTSDEISADHIIHRLEAAPSPSLVVVDYLQLLDQRRRNPSLDEQVKTLREFGVRTGTILVMISQIDRRFDQSAKGMPGVADIRLPNPVDLTAFDRFFFLHEGKLQIARAA
ncbi:MAG: DNA helicase [Pseudomonadota bacterium]